MKKLAFTALILLSINLTHAYQAPKASKAPTIDGVADDLAWQRAEWANIDQLTLGEKPSNNDFSGRFKLVWTSQKLYILAEIIDDVLIDTNADPLELYWEDDTLVDGFMPIGLLYHACLSLAAGFVWFLTTIFIWPKEVELNEEAMVHPDSSEGAN